MAPPFLETEWIISHRHPLNLEVERVVNIPDTIFEAAVFGNTRINGKQHG